MEINTDIIDLLNNLRQVPAAKTAKTETQLEHLHSIFGTPKKSRKRQRDDVSIWREESDTKVLRNVIDAKD